MASGNYGCIRSSSWASGQGGDIRIAAGNLVVQNGFRVVTAALDQGDAGNISVHADSIRFLDQGNIASNAVCVGRGGNVDVVARDILISAANEVAVTNSHQITGIGAQTKKLSNGGRITVTADNLQMLDGGQISTVLRGTGHGADVEVTAKNIRISGYVLDPNLTSAPYALSGIDGRVGGAGGSGTSGNINITADSLTVTDHGAIGTGLYAEPNGVPSGTAGNINVNAGRYPNQQQGTDLCRLIRGYG